MNCFVCGIAHCYFRISNIHNITYLRAEWNGRKAEVRGKRWDEGSPQLVTWLCWSTKHSTAQHTSTCTNTNTPCDLQQDWDRTRMERERWKGAGDGRARAFRKWIWKEMNWDEIVLLRHVVRRLESFNLNSIVCDGVCFNVQKFFQN